MTEEEAKLWSRMEAASKKIMGGAPYKAGQGNENAYATAYRDLVKAGLALKLKAKYNG